VLLLSGFLFCFAFAIFLTADCQVQGFAHATQVLYP
jgi:hypothetical protein